LHKLRAEVLERENSKNSGDAGKFQNIENGAFEINDQ